MLEAFGWGLVGGSALLIGAFVAIARPPGNRLLGAVMAFGAGVLLSAVAYELVAKAVATTGGLRAMTFGLAVGTLTFSLGDIAVTRLGYGNRKDIDGVPPDGGGLSIALGALLDGVPESAVLGLTLLTSGEVGAAMLAAVVISNVPEGVAATASLRNGGWSSRRITALWVSIALASALAAAAGYVLLDGASDGTVAFLFAFAAGAILTMLTTSMVPEAYEHAGRPAGTLTVLGFAVAFAITWLDASI